MTSKRENEKYRKEFATAETVLQRMLDYDQAYLSARIGPDVDKAVAEGVDVAAEGKAIEEVKNVLARVIRLKHRTEKDLGLR